VHECTRRAARIRPGNKEWHPPGRREPFPHRHHPFSRYPREHHCFLVITPPDGGTGQRLAGARSRGNRGHYRKDRREKQGRTAGRFANTATQGKRGTSPSTGSGQAAWVMSNTTGALSGRSRCEIRLPIGIKASVIAFPHAPMGRARLVWSDNPGQRPRGGLSPGLVSCAPLVRGSTTVCQRSKLQG
jgi:hypothetical protein